MRARTISAGRGRAASARAHVQGLQGGAIGRATAPGGGAVLERDGVSMKDSVSRSFGAQINPSSRMTRNAELPGTVTRKLEDQETKGVPAADTGIVLP